MPETHWADEDAYDPDDYRRAEYLDDLEDRADEADMDEPYYEPQSAFLDLGRLS